MYLCNVTRKERASIPNQIPKRLNIQNVIISQSPAAKRKWNTFPPAIRAQLQQLREVVIAAADETPGLTQLEESLKWGEPSYKAKNGSPVRIGWSPKRPDQYGLYFVCTTSLVETFKQMFGNRFRYDNNRGLLFGLEEQLPEQELKACLSLAFRYHELKHQPFLGQV